MRIMQSFEAEATKVLLKLTARSVISPLKHKIDIRCQIKPRRGKLKGPQAYQNDCLLTSCPRQLAKQYAVSIDQILTRRSSDPVITYLPDRSNMAAGKQILR